MFRHLLAAAAVAGAALCAVPAFAEQSLVAQLQSPVPAPVKVVAGGSAWRCEGATCRAEAFSDRALGVDACRALAKAVGPVSAYGDGFDAARLAKCDAGLGGGSGAPVLAKAGATTRAGGL